MSSIYPYSIDWNGIQRGEEMRFDLGTGPRVLKAATGELRRCTDDPEAPRQRHTRSRQGAVGHQSDDASAGRSTRPGIVGRSRCREGAAIPSKATNALLPEMFVRAVPMVLDHEKDHLPRRSSSTIQSAPNALSRSIGKPGDLSSKRITQARLHLERPATSAALIGVLRPWLAARTGR